MHVRAMTWKNKYRLVDDLPQHCDENRHFKQSVSHDERKTLRRDSLLVQSLNFSIFACHFQSCGPQEYRNVLLEPEVLSVQSCILLEKRLL